MILIVLIIARSAIRPILCIRSRIGVRFRIRPDSIRIVKIIIRKFNVWRVAIRIRIICMTVSITRMRFSHSSGSLSSYPYVYYYFVVGRRRLRRSSRISRGIRISSVSCSSVSISMCCC